MLICCHADDSKWYAHFEQIVLVADYLCEYIFRDVASCIYVSYLCLFSIGVVRRGEERSSRAVFKYCAFCLERMSEGSIDSS
jgi:hypothetical protein